MSNDPASFLNKPVKIHSVAARPELNDKIGIAQSYLPNRSRYLVSLPPHISPAPIALKADNLSLPNFSERAKGKIDDIWGMVLTVYHDQSLRAELRRGLTSVESRLPPNVKVEHVAVGILLLLLAVIFFIGLSKTIMLISLISMVFVVALPDIFARRDIKAIVTNFPMRWKEAIEQNTGYKVSLRMATGILVAILLVSSKVLLTSQTSRVQKTKFGGDVNFDRLGHQSAKIPGAKGNRISFTVEEIYKLGYEDGENKNIFGESLPKNHDSMSFMSLDYGYDYDEINYNGMYSSPPTPKQSKFGISTIISLFALARTVKELGFIHGRFDLNVLVSNVRNLPPIRMALLAFMVYRVIKAFL
eukprot:CAMPEP_0176497152 /NCGR_PEP_ID=MMETSP0200_2-20121128/11567_1 /TAXON_ID=947934 /ORGANISM="Chaetoceros sp., Strain GSL56" /LENGTH=358 /DNA_ID=CAMNT_0017895137 /DNA_START=65 /DNA_END=1141 /DNA_ORIENTATION=-